MFLSIIITENDNSESYGTQVVEWYSANQITVTMYFGGFGGPLVPGFSLGSSPEALSLADSRAVSLIPSTMVWVFVRSVSPHHRWYCQRLYIGTQNIKHSYTRRIANLTINMQWIAILPINMQWIVNLPINVQWIANLPINVQWISNLPINVQRIANLPINAMNCQLFNKCVTNCHPSNKCEMNCYYVNKCAMNCQLLNKCSMNCQLINKCVMNCQQIAIS